MESQRWVSNKRRRAERQTAMKSQGITGWKHWRHRRHRVKAVLLSLTFTVHHQPEYETIAEVEGGWDEVESWKWGESCIWNLRFSVCESITSWHCKGRPVTITVTSFGLYICIQTQIVKTIILFEITNSPWPNKLIMHKETHHSIFFKNRVSFLDKFLVLCSAMASYGQRLMIHHLDWILLWIIVWISQSYKKHPSAVSFPSHIGSEVKILMIMVMIIIKCPSPHLNIIYAIRFLPSQ